MEYGLRRYEAAQRLLWFLFFLVCLAVAYPLKGLDTYQRSYAVSQTIHLKSMKFWIELQGIQVQPTLPESVKVPAEGASELQRGIQVGPRMLANFMIYLILVGILFLGGRLLWLVVQFTGKHFVKNLLTANIKRTPGRPKVALDTLTANPERLFPAEFLLKKVNHFPLQMVFHSFRRLKLMLANPQATPSSEELTEKERRFADADWQILYNSWLPFQWVTWMLPVLALVQAASLFYIELMPILSGRREMADMFGPALTGLLPLIQIFVITVFLKLASSFLKRLDELYLSNVDALLYDQLLSRLPFQSSDTLILLEALQRHFKEIQTVLRRLERPAGNEKDGGGRRADGEG